MEKRACSSEKNGSSATITAVSCSDVINRCNRRALLLKWKFFLVANKTGAVVDFRL
jgi:hypothetical protein